MIFWIVNCSIAFLICVFCAGIIIPQILLIAFRKRLFDLPDERKIHHCAVPRLGGIAFKPVVFFTVALLLGINMVMGAFGDVVRNRERCSALGFRLLLHHGSVSGWHGR